MTNKKENRLANFDFATSEEGFDNHISNSIRDYKSLWENVVNMSKYFIENDTNVYDLGCSSGKLIKALHEYNKDNAPNASFYGLDLEQNFIKDFASKDARVNLVCGDISNYSYNRTSFATSIFTLQFTPIETRYDILSRLYDSMNAGAGFVLAEKTISDDAKIQDIMTSMYYEFKNSNFTGDEILEKERKLRYMMKPQTKQFNDDLLSEVGFQRKQVFWTSYNFMAWVCIK